MSMLNRASSKSFSEIIDWSLWKLSLLIFWSKMTWMLHILAILSQISLFSSIRNKQLSFLWNSVVMIFKINIRSHLDLRVVSKVKRPLSGNRFHLIDKCDMLCLYILVLALRPLFRIHKGRFIFMLHSKSCLKSWRNVIDRLLSWVKWESIRLFKSFPCRVFLPWACGLGNWFSKVLII